MEEKLRLRGLTTANDKFSFLLFNYSKQPYFIHYIKFKWWIKNGVGKKYFTLSKIINKWINNFIYEFADYYFNILEPKEVISKEIKEGKDIRDVLGIEAQVYYYKDYREKRVLKFRIL
ncbi:hypothetical protein NLB65_00075 [Candidatus Aminicenantes bacterium AC-335-B20]|jgi:hypothetical protein|nr:hypothetical protein [SCandidatus Aminicenantes bacterium Aminicenantia_JdfR_composite]MCP2596449.1 hypothetical protein [Candidatus Aminicenantes bacterium AC-335-G13]MCP2598842.1 hypothetical protein [Candidatus Aminicenantes bacterium AC-335-B20]MCP2620913.1 hypothetical protein [Candidatus Aminicenantes bacterium AC-334-E05]